MGKGWWGDGQPRYKWANKTCWVMCRQSFHFTLRGQHQQDLDLGHGKVILVPLFLELIWNNIKITIKTWYISEFYSYTLNHMSLHKWQQRSVYYCKIIPQLCQGNESASCLLQSSQVLCKTSSSEQDKFCTLNPVPLAVLALSATSPQSLLTLCRWWQSFSRWQSGLSGAKWRGEGTTTIYLKFL